MGEMMISAILLMAGKGVRMNRNVNKALLPINKKPIYMYSLEKLLSLGFEVICVINKDDEDIILKLPKNVKYTFGGETRGESVLNGLKLVKGEYTIIHDAARPFISNEVLEKIKADPTGPILCYLDVVDTIKLVDDNIKTLNRDKLIKAVTPQCAETKLLADVYTRAFKDNLTFTDDISLIENYYPEIKIKLIKANNEAFKITTELDYKLACLIGGSND